MDGYGKRGSGGVFVFLCGCDGGEGGVRMLNILLFYYFIVFF